MGKKNETRFKVYTSLYWPYKIGCVLCGKFVLSFWERRKDQIFYWTRLTAISLVIVFPAISVITNCSLSFLSMNSSG